MLSVVDLHCLTIGAALPTTDVLWGTIDLYPDASSPGIVMPSKHGVYKAGDHSLLQPYLVFSATCPQPTQHTTSS